MNIRLATTIGLVALLASGCAGKSNNPGWTEEDRANWYRASQGSRLIPADWYFALERHDTEDGFSDVSHISHKFGFINPPSFISQEMPIGFTLDKQADADLKQTKLRWYAGQKSDSDNAEAWVGLNCAACHTNAVNINGAEQIIDGAPGLSDFQSFIEELDQAMIQTRNDDEKWDRFASNVLQDNDTPDNRNLLTQSVDTFLEWQKLTDDMNESPMRYGYGRLDAVGHIQNKILMFNGSTAQDGNPSNAPVSMPFLWNIWRQQKVQWNGVAENSRLKTPGDPIEYGALGRNTGEVLGVFGDVVITPTQGSTVDLITGFKSSVQTANLMRMEEILRKLPPPAWPDELPKPDKKLIAKGDELFKQHCINCHKTEDQWKDDEATEVMVTFEDTTPQNLTDIWMACNAYLNSGPTNLLVGRKDNNGDEMEENEAVITMLAATVKATILGDKKELIKEAVRNFFGIEKPPIVQVPILETLTAEQEARRDACLDATGVDILAYKARPLDGIWATAPYLHNGSVPSLYELLLPADQRTEEFFVGAREFDAQKVGFKTDADKIKTPTGEEFPAFKLVTGQGDMVVEGNSNHGHEYGAEGFSEDDRMALVEYMKSL